MKEELRPILKELDELQEKIQSMEFMGEMSHQLQLLKKRVAWSLVYRAETKLETQRKLIEKLKRRIPSCQELIDQHQHKIEESNHQLVKKKIQIENMVERTSELRRNTEDLKENYSMIFARTTES